VTGHGNKPKVSSHAGAENKVGASLTNDDQTVHPDDYTLQKWQKVNLLRSILLRIPLKQNCNAITNSNEPSAPKV